MKKIFLCALSGFVAMSAFAQQASYIPVDAATMGLAGTAVGRNSGAYAAEYNAATMSLAKEKIGIGLSYGNWAPKTAANTAISLGGMFGLGDRLSLGFYGKFLKDKNASVLTNANGVVAGEVYPNEILGGLSVSYEIVKGLSIGLGGRYASATFSDDVKSSAFGVDVSAAYSNGGLMVGLGVSTLPDIARLGVSYTIAGLTASVEADYQFSGGIMAAGSLEYSIVDMVFVRAGYHFGTDKAPLPSYASLGVGVNLSGIHLDVAYLLASETIGNSLCVGLGYSF